MWKMAADQCKDVLVGSVREGGGYGSLGRGLDLSGELAGVKPPFIHTASVVLSARDDPDNST